MKKILMGTSAIAFAGVSAGQAQAAEWDLDWGGFFNAYAVYTDEDGNGVDGFDIVTNAEIIFTPSITLDNGLTFGAKVEMEAEADGSSQSGVIDESVAFVSGSFGRVELGAEDSSFGRMQRGGSGFAQQGAAGVYSATMTGTFLARGYGAAGNAFQLAGDAVRINYFTPRFSGFQLGVSYARGQSKNDRFFENTDTATPANPLTGDPGNNLAHIMSIDANYVNSFGNVDFEASLGYEQGEALTGGAFPDDPKSYHAGLGVGFSGVLLGASYAHYDIGTSNDIDFYDVGVGYATGPWGVSLGYSLTDADNAYETQQIALNGSYELGTGVTAVAFAGYAEQDFDGGGDIDGFTIGTGFHLSF